MKGSPWDGVPAPLPLGLHATLEVFLSMTNSGGQS